MGHLQKLQHKILNEDTLKDCVNILKKEGKKVVFTNGCFDILHKGHVTYLAKSADLGDVLILALNSDASVKRQGKGDDRPVNQFDARSYVLAGLSFVDFIIEFDEDTPYNLIQKITPDVLVKGGDYDPNETDVKSRKYIVGRDHVLNNNGEVQVIDLVNGFSTTRIIQKLKK